MRAIRMIKTLARLKVSLFNKMHGSPSVENPNSLVDRRQLTRDIFLLQSEFLSLFG
jgi:hypothetical protein